MEERRKNIIKKVRCLLSFFSEQHMLETAAEDGFREHAELLHKHFPDKQIVRISCAGNNATVMFKCMRETLTLLNYLRNEDNEVDDWQYAAMEAIFRCCNETSSVPFDLPYAINGLLLVNCNVALQSFYFTFGSSEDFPFKDGYIVVKAPSLKDAIHLFMDKYPNPKSPDTVNCSFFYTEKEWIDALAYGGSFRDKEPFETISS